MVQSTVEREKYSKSKIIIDKEHYNELLYESRLLKKLHKLGVYNWEGYDIALIEIGKDNVKV